MKHSPPWSKTTLRREGWIQFHDTNWELIADVWIEHRDPKGRAASRLILKAPELLAEAEKRVEMYCPPMSCKECLGKWPTHDCPVQPTRALLDNITGKENEESPRLTTNWNQRQMDEPKIVRSFTMSKGKEGVTVALWCLPNYTYMVEVIYTNTNWQTTTHPFKAFIPGRREYLVRIGTLYCQGWR